MMPSIQRVLTIGAYGFSEVRFFESIQASGADLFCDIRSRRGLRGATYAFANAGRLQQRLVDLAVPYVHLKQLAPSHAARAAQQKHDLEFGIMKRSREELSESFVARYVAECLSTIDPVTFCGKWLGPARAPVFFCVERSHKACHRTLVAAALADGLGVPVEHLEP